MPQAVVVAIVIVMDSTDPLYPYPKVRSRRLEPVHVHPCLLDGLSVRVTCKLTETIIFCEKQSFAICFCFQSPAVSAAKYSAEAKKCTRWPKRRNALADPHKMAMPQGMRERIEQDIAVRKTHISKRLSNYFRTKVDPNPEIDLTWCLTWHVGKWQVHGAMEYMYYSLISTAGSWFGCSACKFCCLNGIYNQQGWWGLQESTLYDRIFTKQTVLPFGCRISFISQSSCWK